MHTDEHRLVLICVYRRLLCRLFSATLALGWAKIAVISSSLAIRSDFLDFFVVIRPVINSHGCLAAVKPAAIPAAPRSPDPPKHSVASMFPHAPPQFGGSVPARCPTQWAWS